jgi:hypothetical protein
MESTIDKKFGAIVEDALRKFPNDDLYALYERYLNGEKDLYDSIFDRVQTHVLQVLKTPPRDTKTFKFTPSAPVKSLKFSPSVKDLLSARRKLDFEIESCIKQSDVYKFSLGLSNGDENKAYKSAVDYYSGGID